MLGVGAGVGGSRSHPEGAPRSRTLRPGAQLLYNHNPGKVIAEANYGRSRRDGGSGEGGGLAGRAAGGETRQDRGSCGESHGF